MNESVESGPGDKPLSAKSESDLQEIREKKRRAAACILEVIAGERSSGEAAQEIGVSLTRYYVIEQQAIEGLVEACPPRPRGPRRDADREILKLKEEIKRLQSQCRRAANLLRLSQRGLGMSPSTLTRSENRKKAGKKTAGKKKRSRRGKVRALVHSKRLRSEKIKDLDIANANGENPGEVTAP